MIVKTFILDEEGEEKQVTATLAYHPVYRGARDSIGGVRGAGPPLEPDEPAELEIESVVDEYGNEVVLDNADEEHILEVAWRQWEEENGPQD